MVADFSLEYSFGWPHKLTAPLPTAGRTTSTVTTDRVYYVKIASCEEVWIPRYRNSSPIRVQNLAWQETFWKGLTTSAFPVSPIHPFSGEGEGPAMDHPSVGMLHQTAVGGNDGITAERNATTELGSPSKPPLLKCNAVDNDDMANKKLTRGISRATDNVNLVLKARNEFALNFSDSTETNQLLDFNVETPVYTFTLPDLTIYPDDFVAFLEKDLIETSTLLALEQAGRLNWWTELGSCQRLWPLATTGDGNCLLHAASLGMWGFHDRLLTLRKALHATLTKGSYRNALWRRWRWQQTLQNKEAGFVYSEEEWQKEWDNLLRLSSTEPRLRLGLKMSCSNNLTSKGPITRGIGALDPISENEGEHDIYESLEEIHVLALAHVLRRPIIVVADTMLKDVTGEPFAPIPFGGIYLPLECRPVHCHQSPLVLTYDAAHFSALVAMERETYVDKVLQSEAVIPLTDAQHQLLPLQYAVDPGPHFNWGIDEHNPKVVHQLTLTDDDKLTLLVQYLEVEHVPISKDKPVATDPSHSLSQTPLTVSNGFLDMDKKSSGSSFESDDSSPSSIETSAPSSGVFGGKSKAAKQLQSVAKQFGSIGRSMSKKFKNLGSFKLGRSNSYKETPSSRLKHVKDVDQDSDVMQVKYLCRSQQLSGGQSSSSSKYQNHILCAKLHTDKRHEYQEEMIKNYLHSARIRFEKEKNNLKGARTLERKPLSKTHEPESRHSVPGTTRCVNPWCTMYGSADSSYLCAECFKKQKVQERGTCPEGGGGGVSVTDGNDRNTLYGIGRSRFYAEAFDKSSDGMGGSGQVVKRHMHPDQTLYLSNSTFYNDVNTPPVARSVVATNAGDVGGIYDSIAEEESSSCDGTQPSSDVVFKLSCRTPKCPFFGTSKTSYYCSQCHKEQKMREVEESSILASADHLRTTQI